jgi:hypothetical protein
VQAGAGGRRLVAGALAIVGVSLLVSSATALLAAAQTSRPVELRIIGRLRAGEAAERVTVHLQGRMVAALVVDRRHPVAAVAVRLPRPGRYGYALSSAAVFEVNRARYRVAGQGGGVVEVRAGRSVVVTGDRRHRVPDTVLASR